MPPRKTHEKFVQEIFALVGDEFTVVGRYVKNDVKIAMKHKTCGLTFDIRPACFLNGSRCRFCWEKKKEEERKEKRTLIMRKASQ